MFGKNPFQEFRATLSEKAQKVEGNAFTAALKAARENGDDTFVVAGKKYKCEDYPKEDNTNDVSDDGDGLDKVQPKAVKKKFKDRKDKDIDNDGDVDSSDEYLHKRRKAVSKAIGENDEEEDNGDENGDDEKKMKKKKKGEEDEVEMNPKMEAAGYTDVAVMKGKGGAQVKVVKDKKGNHVALFTGKGSTQVPIKKMDKKVLQKALDSFSKNGMLGNTLSSIEEKASIRDRLTSVLGEDAAKNRNPNAAKAEKPEDALSGKGAKDMMEPAKNPEVDDTEEKGHDDASKAGKVTKAAGGRNSGDAVRSGDQGIRNPIKKTMEAYSDVQEKWLKLQEPIDGATQIDPDAVIQSAEEETKE